MSFTFKVYKILRPKKPRRIISKLVKWLDDKVTLSTIKKLSALRITANKHDSLTPLEKFSFTKKFFDDVIAIIDFRQIQYGDIKDSGFKFRTLSSGEFLNRIENGLNHGYDYNLNKGGFGELSFKELTALDWVSNTGSITEVISHSLEIISKMELCSKELPVELIDAYQDDLESDPHIIYGNSKEFLFLLNDLINCMIIYLSARV